MLLLAMLACEDAEPELLPGNTLSIRLLNPTEADPWADVDEVWVGVEIAGEIVAEATFGADEELRVPEVTEFGLVRFHLAGRKAGTVVSYGRSGLVVVHPREDQEVPMVFLPVNKALPLTAEVAQKRSYHAAIGLPGGQVLLAGGAGTDGNLLDSLEVYDRATATFVALDSTLPEAMKSPSLAVGDGLEWWLVGGTVAGGKGSRSMAVFDPTSGAVSDGPDMINARSEPCFAHFRKNMAIAVGGSPQATAVDWLQAEAGSGTSLWSEINVNNLDAVSVTACSMMPDNRVLFVGTSLEASGLFDFTDEVSDSVERQDAFAPISESKGGPVPLVDGAMLVPLSSGNVWVGGGLSSGAAFKEGREYIAASGAYKNSVAPGYERVNGSWSLWIEEDWAVLGCGSPDGSVGKSQPNLEILNLSTGESFPAIRLDRSRPGCSATALDDGSVLVTGGFGPQDSSQAGAAIVVPYMEP